MEITVAMLGLNLLIIGLLNFCIFYGFFGITMRWDSGLTTDVAALLSNIIQEDYPDLKNIEELPAGDFDSIIDKMLGIHGGRLRAVKFHSLDGEMVYLKDITDRHDNRDSPGPPELLKFIAELRFRIMFHKPDNIRTLVGSGNRVLGTVETLSVPLMGDKYAAVFDQILTNSFFIGLIISSVVSVLVSFLISKKLSRHSKIFAEQLNELADGRRDIDFTHGYSIETNASALAAESLQKELRFNEEAQLKKLQDIVHDLKTPVAALGLQFEAVTDGMLPLNTERMRLLAGEFSRIREIIDELSKYTKLNSEDYCPLPEVVDMNTMLEEVKHRFELQTEQKGQQIVLDRPKLPSMIETDRFGMMRVLNNLTANAVNNSPENSVIRMSLRAARRIIDEKAIFIIEIENEGKISEEDLPLIFDRLYRSKKSGYTGSGLGLAISKTIVEKNHGKIIAMNTASDTVIFKIEIPVCF